MPAPIVSEASSPTAKPVTPSQQQRRGLPTNVALHPTFLLPARSPAKRRRGPLPRGVVSIKRISRLPLGALAELVGFVKGAEDNGKRVRIVGFDPDDVCFVKVQSLDGPLLSDDGATTTRLLVKPANLRRLWTGLSTSERLRLRLRRAAS